MSDQPEISRARRITATVSIAIAAVTFATCFILPVAFPPEALVGADVATMFYLVLSLPLFGMTLGLTYGARKGQMFLFTVAGTIVGFVAVIAIAATALP